MYMSFHQSVGMSVYQDVHQCVLCELNSSYSLFLFLKLCICFAHELMCMWFEHSSFFHLMNISILGISDAVNLFNYWCIPVLLFILYSATEKFCLFVWCFTSQVNSYGHCGTVSSPNHTFSWAGLNKRLTSNSCTYFRL